MTELVCACLLEALIFILVGWIMGESAADREHRRRQDREQQDALLRSIRLDLDSVQRSSNASLQGLTLGSDRLKRLAKTPPSKPRRINSRISRSGCSTSCGF